MKTKLMILAAILLYAALAFFNLELNPTKWSEGTRGVFLVMLVYVEFMILIYPNFKE